MRRSDNASECVAVDFIYYTSIRSSTCILMARTLTLEQNYISLNTPRVPWKKSRMKWAMRRMREHDVRRRDKQCVRDTAPAVTPSVWVTADTELYCTGGVVQYDIFGFHACSTAMFTGMFRNRYIFQVWWSIMVHVYLYPGENLLPIRSFNYSICPILWLAKISKVFLCIIISFLEKKPFFNNIKVGLWKKCEFERQKIALLVEFGETMSGRITLKILPNIVSAEVAVSGFGSWSRFSIKIRRRSIQYIWH